MADARQRARATSSAAPSATGRATSSAASRGDGNYARIYKTVQRIPRGRVSTYGQVAVLAGLPGHARQVGYALNALTDHNVPWHRVINAKGEISKRAEPEYEEVQRLLLEGEGVRFNAQGRVSLRQYGWRATAQTRPAAARVRKKPARPDAQRPRSR